MSISIPTYDSVLTQVLAFYRNRFSGRDLSTESFLGKLARAEAMTVFLLLQSIANADNDSVPTNKSSSAALDLWAIAAGVPGATATTYGRKAATPASGLTGTITGTNATVVPISSVLNASDGITQFQTVAAYTIPGAAPGTGSVTGTFDCLTGGTVGNLPVSSVLTWVNPVAGLDTTVTTTALPSTAGIDKESDAALLTRIQTKMQTPPKGGTSADFRTWGEAVSGVVRAYPYPLRGGIGTAHIVITSVTNNSGLSSNGTARQPTATVQSNVDNYINGTSTVAGQRPVTMQGYKSLIPYMPASQALTIRCRMSTAKAKYAFDWNDVLSGPYSVAAYSAGAGGAGQDLLTLSLSAPATLTAAVDAGNKPRLQILATSMTATANSVAVPVLVQVTGYSGASNTILALQNPLPTNYIAPSIGDKIYAGGPTVTQTANAIQAYINGLGPSRVGGYAESTDFWEDTASIARITQIALDQVDTDGSRFFTNIVSSGVTIAVGSGSAAATDYQATDTTSNGPALLYCKYIAVTA